MKVAVLLAEGFETIEALTTVDILRRAGVACSTFGTKSLEVTTSHSVTIKADKVLNEEAYDYDVVVLPGGMPGSVNLRDDEIYLDIKDSFLDIFEGEACDFEVDYVKENIINLEVPENINPVELSKHPMWDEYDARCIACGKCNFVCPTCTCFTMQDIYYKENENVGERRRVWASCQVDGYTDMAGGHSFRKKQGERMRYKVMHKIHDFNKRFGYQMCVGCGRCDDACPQYISLSECIEKVADVVLVKEEAK